MSAAFVLILHSACTPTPAENTDSSADSGTDTAADTGTDTAGLKEPNFEDDVYEVYDESCSDCHEGWGGRDESDVYDFLLTQDSRGLRFVVPGDRAQSLLYSKVASETPLDDNARMPNETFRVEPADLARLSTWIAAGAANDAEWDEIQSAIWKRGLCSSCHGDWGKTATAVLNSLLTIEKNAYWLVDPGDPELSLLYLKLSLTDPPVGAQMPVQIGYLTDEQIERLGLWIDAGAEPTAE